MKRYHGYGKLWLLIACVFILASEMLHAAELRISEPTFERRGVLMVAANEFEKSGLARVAFDKRTKRVSLTHGNATLSMDIGSPKAWLNDAKIFAPVSAEFVGDRAMVPARFTATALGIPGLEIKMPIDVRAGASGSPNITGRVLYAGRPLPNTVLRLVRAEDFSFVRSARARTDASGAYSFSDVPDAAYRVYAYTGDNPGYFNRSTPVIRLDGKSAKVDDIQMGRILEAQDPPRGAILSPDRDIVFNWTSCPFAVHYHLSIVDPSTNEEVFSAETAKPYCTVPISRIDRVPLYEWRVIATDRDGAFLGGTPGAGADPLAFRVSLD